MQELHQQQVELKVRLDRINDMLNRSQTELELWQSFIRVNNSKR